MEKALELRERIVGIVKAKGFNLGALRDQRLNQVASDKPIRTGNQDFLIFNIHVGSLLCYFETAL